MVKKLKAMASKQKNTAGIFDNALAASVRDSAEKIWLAGMGAFAKAQAEGKQVFDSLVKDGAVLQKKTQSVAEDTFGEVSGRMSSMAEGVQSKAGQHWDKLETIFEDRTARAMKKMGMPTATDIEALNARIDALSAKLDARSRPAAKPAKTAAKTGAKTASKKAPVAKKRASKKAATA